MKSITSVLRVLCLALPFSATIGATPVPISIWSGDGIATDPISGNNATLYNGASYADGRWAQAFALDGVNDVLVVANSSSLNRPHLTNAYTICAWIKWSGNQSLWGALPLVRQSLGNNNCAFNIDIDNGGHFGAAICDGNVSHAVSATSPAGSIQPGIWYHVAGTFDGQTVRAYINGTLVASTSTAYTVGPATGSLYIGRDENNGCWFGGLIDQIELYDQALTESEIRARRDFNLPPIANGGADQVIYTGAATQQTVTLDGTASTDPENDALAFHWTGSFGTAEGATPTVTLPVGIHMITLTVEDAYHQTSSTTVHVAVVQGTDLAGYNQLHDLVQTLTAQAEQDAQTIAALTAENASLRQLLQSLSAGFDQIRGAAATIDAISRAKQQEINTALAGN